MPDLTFKTHVSGTKNGEHYIRSKSLIELIGKNSFVETLYLSITGREATEPQSKMLNALLVAGFDHGIAPASGFVPRVVAASGNEMTHALAAGLLTIGPYHGGAVEEAAIMFSHLHETNEDMRGVLMRYHSEKKVLSGFGHRAYKESDPRTQALFALADQIGLSDTYRHIARDMEALTEAEFGKKLVLNIDGAFAAVLLDLGLPAKAGNGLFALARVGGMIAHVLEEYQEKPVRRLSDESISFDPS